MSRPNEPTVRDRHPVPAESADDVPRWRRDPTWVLLLLRAFLGVTFLYAGLSKIADSSFLDASDPTSFAATLGAVRDASPIGGLLGPVAAHPFAFGLVMALAETAVGIGVLLGLLTRIAAAGGMVLSLILWLTVSWNADPWYTSADLVYLLALTPLLLAGSTPFSLDAWLASVRARGLGAGEDRTRRLLVVGAAGVAGLVVVGASSLFRKAPGRDTAGGTADTTGSTGPSSGASAPSGTSGGSGGSALVDTDDVPVGGAKQVTHDGDTIWVLQLTSGSFTAYNAACPHQGCPVKFESKDTGFACPCHGSTFDAGGKRLSGPAQRGLTQLQVSAQNGKVVTT